jgi:glycosyltransferase involved in cell wall biosynthesis
MLMKKSIEKGLSSVVDFVGLQKDVTKFMQICDVIILPSIKDEDFPNVVIEAMALAKPVIATKVAGTVEQIYNNKTGLLVSPNNALELAEALKTFITNPEIARPFGLAGQAIYLEHFTAKKSVERYKSLYRKLLKDEG